MIHRAARLVRPLHALRMALLPALIAVPGLVPTGLEASERPSLERPPLSVTLDLSGEARAVSGIESTETLAALSLARSTSPAPAGPDLAEIAYRISYVGTLLLTADRIWRSVDSVLDGMEVVAADGSRLRLSADPSSRGFEVMFRVSRPLGF